MYSFTPKEQTTAEHLHVHGRLTVAACCHRDRMDVDSLLEISSEVVSDTTGTKRAALLQRCKMALGSA